MDVHKPKPIRNWREFLKEYAIIVIGVLTALAAEQAVEWLHWRNQVAEARSALADELAATMRSTIDRVRIYDCVEKRLDFVAGVLDKASASGSLPPLPAISSAPGATWPTGVWSTVVASQTATHFPRSELNALGDVYATMQMVSHENVEEWQHWSILNSMVGPGRRLDPASESELRKTLSMARASNFTMALVGGQIMRKIEALHLPFSPETIRMLEKASRQPSPREICKPMPASAPSQYGQAQGNSRIPEIRDYQQHLPFAQKPR